MKVWLLMHAPGGGPYQIQRWSQEDRERHMEFMVALNRMLEASGELVGVAALAAPAEARLVRADPDGRPVTDGVFPESKEFLAGFWTVEVPSLERAYEIAARISMAPGPGGTPLRMDIEVRASFSRVRAAGAA